MRPIDAYGGSDDASMAADNTSAFDCRPARAFAAEGFRWGGDYRTLEDYQHFERTS